MQRVIPKSGFGCSSCPRVKELEERVEELEEKNQKLKEKLALKDEKIKRLHKKLRKYRILILLRASGANL